MRLLRALAVMFMLNLGLLVGFVPYAHAQSTTPPATQNPAIEDPFEANCTGSAASSSSFCKNADEENSNRKLVYGDKSLLMQITQFIVFLTGLISVIMIIIGGFKYIVSNGDANSVKSAKDTILYAVIGLIVAVSCQFIVSFVLSRFI